MPNCISAADFSNLIKAGAAIDIIDVRTPAEFREVHITVARNEPLDRLDPKAIEASRNGSANQPLYVVCRSGARGSQACEKFIAAGCPNVINVQGGTMACVSEGVPVVRGQKSMPINCQVQILSGALIVIGAVLSAFAHPYWAALPAVMGAGLVFSGVTNSCLMGVCLAKMPWNR